MGGQFPAEKSRDAFKNPIFYAVAAAQTAPKNELSQIDAPKTGFNSIFLDKCAEIPAETETVAQCAIAGVPPDFARFVYQDWSKQGSGLVKANRFRLVKCVELLGFDFSHRSAQMKHRFENLSAQPLVA